ncbi:MAG: CDGSH iron-sulfur domain-containing protein [Pseudomonas sp.]|nr:CDGSH iron-sulfur domain-containing protein [Pseudomonas sp.]MDO9617409.1 CDGSH iron-sulfur domain-containing protein [Pseudomonas sp.]MDP2446516.1 CDGSH iron-sulfur domain-containing protein [Pseudomonas sp.]MDZ4335778.1 CDGSH iron-sulfur domain-containing protein [Pseudomonas sp.]
MLELQPEREQFLLLCRCARSQRLPYCDGSHNQPVSGFKARWRRFWRGL